MSNQKVLNFIEIDHVRVSLMHRYLTNNIILNCHDFNLETRFIFKIKFYVVAFFKVHKQPLLN